MSTYETGLSEILNIIKALRVWLGDGLVKNDNEEWVRTECVLLLAKLAGEDVSTVRRDRAVSLHKCIESVLDSGVWPNPFMVRAWLACLDALSAEKDATLARKLLSFSQAPQTTDPFDKRRERDERWSVRARLALISRLSPTPQEVVAWTKIVEDAAHRGVRVLVELVQVPLETIIPAIRDTLVEAVTNAFSPTGSLRERTSPNHAALTVFDLAIDHSRLTGVPQAWFFGTTALTTSAHPETASYACNVLSQAVVRFDQQWAEADRAILATIRHALLRASRDGRALVVGAARRALEDARHSSAPIVQDEIARHPDTERRLLQLAEDPRLAVVVAGQPWVRQKRP